jgi:hypothetical protein
MDDFAYIDVAGSDKAVIYVWTTYKLRSGRKVYQKRYFDSRLRLAPHRL